MANFRGPYFWQINSHSAFGLHSMQQSLFGWDAGAGGMGDLQTSVGGTVDAITFVNSFVDKLTPFFPTTYFFDSVQIYRQLLETDIPQPVAGASLGAIPGESAAGTWTKAVQETITWRTAGFGLFKLVLLDAESNDDYNPVVSASADASLLALHNFVTASTTAISGRDNTKPSVFIRLTKTLNEKLRKQYHLD